MRFTSREWYQIAVAVSQQARLARKDADMYESVGLPADAAPYRQQERAYISILGKLPQRQALGFPYWWESIGIWIRDTLSGKRSEYRPNAPRY